MVPLQVVGVFHGSAHAPEALVDRDRGLDLGADVMLIAVYRDFVDRLALLGSPTRSSARSSCGGRRGMNLAFGMNRGAHAGSR